MPYLNKRQKPGGGSALGQRGLDGGRGRVLCLNDEFIGFESID